MADIKILDGGFSAQLSTHVGEKIDGDPLWTARFLATNPDAVYATHLDFLRAGADIIETNTYQASIPGLMKHLLISEEESIDLLRGAVKLAKKAVQDYKQEAKDVENKNPLIAGSCGPFGASLHDASEYTGCYGKNIPREVMKDWHRPRIQTLIDEGVDILALETIPCAEEAEAIVELLREFPNVKAWLSFSCQGSNDSMVDGSKFQKVAVKSYRTALPGQIIAIGTNCLAAKHVTPLFTGINGKDETIPLIVYPNNGEIYSPTGWQKGDMDCSFEAHIPEWLELGVRYIGGCCRIYAKNIKSIRNAVKNYEAHMTSK